MPKKEFLKIINESNAHNFAAMISYGEDITLRMFSEVETEWKTVDTDSLEVFDFERYKMFLIANAIEIYQKIDNNWMLAWKGEENEEV